MTAPNFFKDFDKTAKIILDDDYSLKKTLRVKALPVNGLTIQNDSEYFSKDGRHAINAKVTGKFKHLPTGFAIDKLVLKEDGGISGDFALGLLAKGLTFTFRGDEKPLGDVGIEKVGYKYAVKSELDMVKLSNVKLSGVFCHMGAKLGSEVEVGLPDAEKEIAIKKWSSGVSWGSPKFFTSAIVTQQQKSGGSQALGGLDYSVSSVYKVGAPLALAARAIYPSNGKYTFTLGGIYKCGPTTEVKAKGDLGGTLTASVIHDVSFVPKVSLVSTIQSNVRDFRDYKVGFGAFLG